MRNTLENSRNTQYALFLVVATTGAACGSSGKIALPDTPATPESASPGDGGAEAHAATTPDATQGLSGEALCPPGAPPAVVATDASYLGGGIVVDAQYVYYAGWKGGLARVPKAGGDPVTLATYCCGRGLKSDGSFLYWADSLSIQRARMPDGEATSLVPSRGVPLGLAVGDVDLFWVDSSTTTLLRAPKTGGDSTNVPIAGGLAEDIAVDQDNLYWIDDSANLIARPHAWGTERILSDEAGASSIVQQDDTFVYYVTRDNGNLRRVPKLGGTVWTLADGTLTRFFAFDQRALYWGEWSTRTVRKVDKEGGASVTVATVIEQSPVSLGGIAVDDHCVYFLDGNNDTSRYAVNLLRAHK
jgi:hypothetical protein